MWYVSIFDAKEGITRSEINRERMEWLKRAGTGFSSRNARRLTGMKCWDYLL